MSQIEWSEVRHGQAKTPTFSLLRRRPAKEFTHQIPSESNRVVRSATWASKSTYVFPTKGAVRHNNSHNKFPVSQIEWSDLRHGQAKTPTFSLQRRRPAKEFTHQIPSEFQISPSSPHSLLHTQTSHCTYTFLHVHLQVGGRRGSVKI